MTYTGKLFWQQVGIGHWALVIAPHTPDASPKGRSCANKLAEQPNAKAPLNPLAASGEGRQSEALAGWGSWGLISNQADIILGVRN
ncbi:MAG: hypothetical protein ACYTXA_00970 [Nostoc sp.]